jgi:nucleoid DNA-binding protein
MKTKYLKDILTRMCRHPKKYPLTNRSSVTNAQRLEIIKGVFDEMIECLLEGCNFEIKNFGTIKRKERPGRTYRNPKTGDKIKKDPATTLKFNIAKKMRDRLNEQS